MWVAPPWFSMHLKSIATVFSEEIGAKKVRSAKGQHTGICGVRTQRRSHHWHPVETSGCGHATFGFRSAPATAWTQWCISANKGLPSLAIVTKFSPLPEQNDDLQFCLPWYLPARVWAVTATRAGARSPTKRHAETNTVYHVLHKNWDKFWAKLSPP